MIDPRALEISTVKTCSIECEPFCPQRAFREAYGDERERLRFSDYAAVLERVPKDVRIIFAGFSEPFLNRDGLKMIEHTHAQGYGMDLYSTMVGCKPEHVDRLAKIPFRHFCLHLPDPGGVARVPSSDAYKEVLFRTITKMQIHSFSVMNDAFLSNERAGNCDGTPPRHVRGPFFCGKLVAPQFVMLPNCDVVLCCMDWKLRHRLGNLLTETYEQIEASDAFREIAKARFRLDGDALCRSCQWAVPLPVQLAYDAQELARNAVRKWFRIG